MSHKYGADRVAQIITFATMASKAAIRDVGRVLDVPLRECDLLAKMVPVHQGRSKSLDDALAEVPEFKDKYESGPEFRRLIDVARALEGVSRHVGVHAAGVVIAPEPLVNHVPLQMDPDREGVITQYDMKAVGDIGLLKMDFLGLANLDIIATVPSPIPTWSRILSLAVSTGYLAIFIWMALGLIRYRGAWARIRAGG